MKKKLIALTVLFCTLAVMSIKFHIISRDHTLKSGTLEKDIAPQEKHEEKENLIKSAKKEKILAVFHDH